MPSNELLTIIPIILITVAVMAVAFAAAFGWLRRLARRRYAVMMERYPNARKVIYGAHFFGQESKGVFQTRGNGTLVITDHELVFEKWVPQKEYVIPLNRIVTIEMPNSFLGKTTFTPLVKVVYRTDTGEQDAIAWSVRDAAGLKSQLEQFITTA
jgi:hypothetical protein